MYKIFVNDNPFVIAHPDEKPEAYPNTRVIEEHAVPAVMEHLKKLETLQFRSLMCITPEADKLFQSLMKEFIMIKAAGGIVINPHKELLLIKRLGKWDLPKGKIDPHESTEHAALREVEEECGIQELRIRKFLAYSYHTYKQQGYRFIKQTSWYLMDSSWTGKLQPQLEENITEVKWVAQKELKIDQLDSYLSIKDILLQI